MRMLVTAIVAGAVFPAVVRSSEVVTPAGKALAAELTAMKVEDGWKADRHVDWQTGKAVRPADPKAPAPASHAAAFVAAACDKLGVPMLRPLKAGETAATAPKGMTHGGGMLATAQADWLKANGAAHGWVPVAGPAEAQAAANAGRVVVAVVRGDARTDGHAAVVHPWARSAAGVSQEGPEVTQAGVQNFDHNTLKAGFKHHPAAWPTGVRFYAHELKK